MSKRKELTRKVLSKQDIIARCQPLPTKEIEVPGWGASVEMKNVDFSKLLELKKEAGDDNETYSALIVGEVCGIEAGEILQMQRGNGAAFMTLFSAANSYLNGRFGDEEIKK